MEKKELPTPKELMKIVGYEYGESVRYRQSRTILSYINKPVIAYGYGFNGFVCVFKTSRNYLKAYGYGIKHLFTKYPDAGFCEMDVDEALKIINTNELLVKRELDSDAFNEGKLMPNYSNERLVLATIEYTQREKWSSGSFNSPSQVKLRLVRLKSGKIRSEKWENWRDKYMLCDLKEFIKNIEKKEGIKKVLHGTTKITNIKKNVPEDILNEVNDILLIKDI